MGGKKHFVDLVYISDYQQVNFFHTFVNILFSQETCFFMSCFPFINLIMTRVLHWYNIYKNHILKKLYI